MSVAMDQILVNIGLARSLKLQNFPWRQMDLVVTQSKNVTIQHLVTLQNNNFESTKMEIT